MAPVVERRKPIQFAKGLSYEGVLPKGKWVGQPKFDGLRMLLDADNNVALTLTGLPIPNAAHILRAMRDSKAFKGVVIDAEGVATDWNLSQSIIKSQSEHPRARELTAHCFDILTHQQWEEKKCETVYRTRYAWLTSHLRNASSEFLSLVPSWPIETVADVDRMTRQMIEHGWGGIQGGAGVEGIMLKDLNAPYAFRKNKFWLKSKPEFDADLVSIGATEGRGAKKGMLGAILLTGPVEWGGDQVTVTTEVGTGFDDATRRALWAEHNQGTLVGRTVEIRHEGVTKNGALRFPRFHRMRTDKDAGLA